MGGINTKEEIIARLDELDKEEININKQLRELQIELNGIVPVKDRVKVKKEYFDNISMGDLGKDKENKESYNDDLEEIENENLEDLEEEDEKENKKKKKKKDKSEKEAKYTKKNNKKKKNNC